MSFEVWILKKSKIVENAHFVLCVTQSNLGIKIILKCQTGKERRDETDVRVFTVFFLPYLFSYTNICEYGSNIFHENRKEEGI